MQSSDTSAVRVTTSPTHTTLCLHTAQRSTVTKEEGTVCEPPKRLTTSLTPIAKSMIPIVVETKIDGRATRKNKHFWPSRSQCAIPFHMQNKAKRVLSNPIRCKM